MAAISLIESHFLIAILAACSLLYEMVIASGLVLLFGDVVYFFSLTVAFFILFMGIGSQITKKVEHHALIALLFIECLISILGATSGLVLFEVASRHRNGALTVATAFLYCMFIGIFTGMEIPLLFKITEGLKEARERFAYLLIFDYLGSLLGSVAFAFFLLPKLDLAGTGIATAILNLLTVGYILVRVRLSRPVRIAFTSTAMLSGLLLLALSVNVKAFQDIVDFRLFQVSPQSKIVSNFRTRYQKIVVTLTPADDIEPEDGQSPGFVDAIGTIDPQDNEQWISIYLNGFIQAFSPFKSETDFYHHPFVHPAMILSEHRRRVLILGGGDGLPAKEVQKYSEVERIVNVDLDAEWVDFTKNDPVLRAHSFDAFRNPKLELVVSDAFRWVRESQDTFDVILVDFPEGIDFPLARSYSTQFLRDLKRLVAEDGVISFQVDFFDNPVYWCIIKTMKDSGFHVIPHHTLDPKGAEGLILLSKQELSLSDYGPRADFFPFVKQNLLVAGQAMDYYRVPALIDSRSAELKTNTFYHPTFLSYYRATFPWAIPIGKDF